ncbi:helix-turn-helix domain-containing protein [Candidatus Palauibacter sp.]|uniref:helix-turn-helix domain-containing protein n=1 Tax=Candidatus Palauibacter sp. TaxID=3101350 RepID=UPI003D0D4E49
MAIATKSYNPGFLSDSELREMFCVRVGELQSIVETLRENTGSSNQHVIVVGTRGSGKTTLLLRVASEIRSDSELSSRLHPIMFAEESYRVGTCGEFWLECLSRLAQQEPLGHEGADLRCTVAEIWKERDDRLLRERCLAALLDFADREGKRLVLGVENLNMMFSDMMDDDAGWCLRKTLQTEPRIMMIATATSRFGEMDRPDRALFDLFRVLTLRPLDRDESAVLCESVVGRSLEPGAARRVQILTGGSPRLLAILAQFSATRSFRALMADLLELVDEHTAYFKSHLESLPPQERRVYLALAELWKPATAREVAERARTEVSKCSSQLKRLIGRGVVSHVGGTSRRKHYYASERLYNIYYLLRRSRGADSLVGALIEFMDAYCSRADLAGLADGMVADIDDADAATRVYYRMAIERLSRLPELAWHFLRRHPGYVTDDVREATDEAGLLLQRAAVALAHDDNDRALGAWNDLLQRFGTSAEITVQDLLAKALVEKSNLLCRLRRFDEVIVAHDEAVVRFVPDRSPALRRAVADALLNKAVCLRESGRPDDALDACTELIHAHGVNDSAVSVVAARALRALLLGELDQTAHEMAAYDELDRLSVSGHASSPPILDLIAGARLTKAARFCRLGRWDESIAECDRLVADFGECSSARLWEMTGKSMLLKSSALGVLGRSQEQRSTCDEVLNRLDRHDRAVTAGETPVCARTTTLSLRVEAHQLRLLSCIGLRDTPAALSDTRAVLGILSQLDAVPDGLIGTLLSASLLLSFPQMATLIRESPSADRLLPLTTALELEMGLHPRVAIEIRKVAEDIQLDLAQLHGRSKAS